MTDKRPAIAPLCSPRFEFTNPCEEKYQIFTGLLPDIPGKCNFVLRSYYGAIYFDRFRASHYAFTAGGGEK